MLSIFFVAASSALNKKRKKNEGKFWRKCFIERDVLSKEIFFIESFSSIQIYCMFNGDKTSWGV
jgi:hypothetical protein